MGHRLVYTDKHRVPFLIDEEDFEAVSHYSWHIGDRGYPQTSVGKSPDQRTLTLHLFLLGPAPDGMEWDHRDRDRRNNCRGNLRAATPIVTARNRNTPKNNTSGVMGVCWKAARRKWRVQIQADGRNRYVGSFATLEAATAARRAAEVALWGDAR